MRRQWALATRLRVGADTVVLAPVLDAAKRGCRRWQNHVAGERMFVDYDRITPMLRPPGRRAGPTGSASDQSQRRTRLDHRPRPQCGNRSKLTAGEAALLRIVPRQRPGAHV
jgi:hypothetical protein